MSVVGTMRNEDVCIDQVAEDRKNLLQCLFRSQLLRGAKSNYGGCDGVRFMELAE